MESFGDCQIVRQYNGGGVLTFLIFMGIIPLLDNLRVYLKVQWFSLWFQTRISLFSCPKISSVDHSFAMSSLVILAPTKSLSTSSKSVGIWHGIYVAVMRSSLDYRVFTCTKIRISPVSPQEASLMGSSRVENWILSAPFRYLMIYPGSRSPIEPSLVGAEGSDEA